ncbi:MAG: multidrug effflux MFS transporter [Thauera sp.]
MAPSALLAVLVVALTSLGPLSTDFYLPSLPAIGRALATDSAGVQLTLSVYLLGFGLGQLLLGPLSDRFGRRPVMLWGMAVFTVSSAACALASSLEALVAARLLQALGACAGPVLGRAVVRDVYGPQESARVLSHVSTATALAPLLAPVFGGWLTAGFGWRATFVVLTGYGLLLMALVGVMLRETNAHPDPRAMEPARMLANYRTLLADPVYRSALLIGCGAFAALFAFISGSPFVYIELFGMSPLQMGLAFGLNVTGFMLGTTLSARLSRCVGPARLIRFGVFAGGACGLVLAALALAGVAHPAAVMAPVWGVTAAIGLILPNATALGLSGYPKMAGAAASLMGFMHMGLGAGAGLVVGHGVQSSTLPLGLTVAAGMLFSLAAWALGPRR